MKILVTDKQILVQAPYADRELCKALPGRRWDPGRRAWVYPKSASMAAAIRAAWPEEHMPELEALAEGLAHSAAAKAAAVPPKIPLTKTTPWDHQRRAYWFAYPLQGACLALGMGAGKSKVVCDLVANRGHQRVLVLCPTSVVSVWPEQFEQHCAVPVKIVSLGASAGSTAKRTTTLLHELEIDYRMPVVVLVNYEAAWRDPLSVALKKAGFDLLVLDESHKIKAPGGKISMFCRELGKIIPYRLALTGTPFPHSPLDVYSQYRAIDPGVFGTSYIAFRNRYAVLGGYGGHEVLRYQNLDELNRKFYSIAFRVEAADVLDLPEKVTVHRTAALSPMGRRVYDAMEGEFVADLEAGRITATNALVRLLRLQQITGGHITTDAGESTEVDTTKRDLLIELLDDLAQDEPVVVFAQFHADLDNIHAAAATTGRHSMELSGRRDERAEWVAGGAEVLAVQIQAGGLGIDLTRARYCCFYSTGFSLGNFEQAAARVHRPGQIRNVTYIHLLIDGTVDETVYYAIRTRKKIVEQVLTIYQDSAKV